LFAAEGYFGDLKNAAGDWVLAAGGVEK